MAATVTLGSFLSFVSRHFRTHHPDRRPHFCRRCTRVFLEAGEAADTDRDHGCWDNMVDLIGGGGGDFELVTSVAESIEEIIDDDVVDVVDNPIKAESSSGECRKSWKSF